MSSILDDVKHQLGINPDNTAFDSDVTIHINTVFADLNQLGVGPVEGYAITSKTNQWEEFFTDPKLNAVKSYVFLRVKLLFDPPPTGFVTAAVERQIKEMEWRINVVADYG